MSLSRMASVDYLVGHVAAGDGRGPSAGSPMTRYYTAEGYPPGTWLGTGLTSLGSELAGTFSAPKSVSALWALADHPLQEQFYLAHRAAMTVTLELVEAEALFTRTGARGARRVRTGGMIAAAFDHWDSRRGDPQLHTHVTIANRVQGPDGEWRTLDSATLQRAVVAYSETYNQLLADEVTRRTGLGWEQRERGGRGRRLARDCPRATDTGPTPTGASCNRPRVEVSTCDGASNNLPVHIRRQPSTFSECNVHQQTVPAKVSDMYEVRVTADVASDGPIQCTDLDAAADVLQQRLISSIRPGRRVMWVVRCPSGRLVRGDITINGASTDRLEAVREHVTEIRDILAKDGRSRKSPTRDNEE